MNEQNYEELNDIAVSFEHLTTTIELAENMVGELVCGSITDDEEKTKLHIGRLWSLMVNLVELAHLREKEIEILLKTIQIEKKSP